MNNPKKKRLVAPWCFAVLAWYSGHVFGQTGTAGEIEPQNNTKDDADLPGFINTLPSGSIKNIKFTAQIGLASSSSSYGDKDYYIVPVGSSQPSKVRINIDADDGSGLNSIQFEVRRRSDDFLFFAENSDESTTAIRQSFEETYNVLGESYLLLYGASEGHEYNVTTYWVENSPMDGELEPNDSKTEAASASTHDLNELPVSEPWQGNLSTTSDVDWFYFDADASTINIKFRAEQPDRDGCPKRCNSSSTLKLTLYDDNGNFLTTKSADPGLEGEQEQFTYTIQELNKGRHWIKVETPSGYSFSDTGAGNNTWAHKTYSITVDYTELAAPSSTITAQAGTGGSISPTSVEVEHDQTTTFTVTPDADYEIAEVTGCNGTLSGTTYTTGAITGPCVVNASFQLNIVNDITIYGSASAGGSIYPSLDYGRTGDIKTFTVTPDSGYEIASVSGCSGSLSGNTYSTAPLTDDCVVTASFQLVSSTGSGANCNTYGTSGAYVQKIFVAYLGRPAAPAGLAYFADYLDRNNEQGKLILFDDLFESTEAQNLYGGYTLTGKIDQFYQFMFGRAAKSGGLNYWVSQINGGYFTEPASAAYIADAASGSDMAVLDAKQVAASKLTCAIGDDAEKLAGLQNNLAAARQSIAAVRTQQEAAAYDGAAELQTIMAGGSGSSSQSYQILVNAGSGGSVYPGSATVSYGATKSFTVTPDQGYQIASVSGCLGTLSGSTFTTSNITGPCAIEATFEPTSDGGSSGGSGSSDRSCSLLPNYDFTGQTNYPGGGSTGDNDGDGVANNVDPDPWDTDVTLTPSLSVAKYGSSYTSSTGSCTRSSMYFEMRVSSPGIDAGFTTCPTGTLLFEGSEVESIDDTCVTSYTEGGTGDYGSRITFNGEFGVGQYLYRYEIKDSSRDRVLWRYDQYLDLEYDAFGREIAQDDLERSASGEFIEESRGAEAPRSIPTMTSLALLMLSCWMGLLGARRLVGR